MLLARNLCCVSLNTLFHLKVIRSAAGTNPFFLTFFVLPFSSLFRSKKLQIVDSQSRLVDVDGLNLWLALSCRHPRQNYVS